jgi:DNA topoisomerase-1
MATKTKLVIVESPAKARTISKILGKSFVIKASLGHVRDLPKGKLGIDVLNNFTPTYTAIRERKKVLDELKKSAASASAVYLATDPDREGEAISWHIIEAAKLDKDTLPLHRVVFHEITKEAVEEAFKHPHAIDMDLVNAQQARRLLDRLVGYKLSPLLWRKVQRGLSAGRVQSAALRLIVDREREIQNFVPTEYWTIEAELAKSIPKGHGASFRALLIGLEDGKKLHIPNQMEAERLKDELESSAYAVKSVQIKDASRQPSPPFITSTLQQEAYRKLRFTASRTMRIAQQLYEGVTIGNEGSVGLITYMRTDSTNVAASAIVETRDFIHSKYGDNFLPPHPRSFEKKRKFAQEAHEAIRPTKIHREPSQLQKYLTSEQAKLYDLIWKRMVASQMAAALFKVTTVDMTAECRHSQKVYLLRTTSSVNKFPGFMVLYTEGKDEGEGENGKVVTLPELKANDKLTLLDLFPEQYFTQPPLRYTEATLIKTLEQKGIGRPSTYAPILSTIQEKRGYVLKDKGKIYPDEIGFIVSDLLTQHFPKIVDLSFTARMEKDLDEIAQGNRNWVSVLHTFYDHFEKTLLRAADTIERIDMTKATDEVCPECGKPMVIKIGRFGKFIACSGYPECKKTMPFKVTTGVTCPECKEGELLERMSKKKRRFYSCSRYPKCKFAISSKPIKQPCPQCGKLLVQYRGDWAKCTSCTFKDKPGELEKVEAKV